MPGENRSTFDSSVADGVANPTKAQIFTNRSAFNGSGGVLSTEKSTTMSIPASDSVGKASKSSSRGLLAVTRKQSVGTSYTQRVISPGDMVLEERREDKLHRAQIFSSQKIPQPFLDR